MNAKNATTAVDTPIGPWGNVLYDECPSKQCHEADKRMNMQEGALSQNCTLNHAELESKAKLSKDTTWYIAHSPGCG
jgi:hypothetical protein